MSAYATLEKRFSDMLTLSEVGAILGWDQAVIMSKAGAGARGRHFALLGRLRQEWMTAKDMASLIEAAHGEQLDPWQSANLREMTRAYETESLIPASLVEALSEATTHSEMVWRQARSESDFNTLLPALDRVLDLTREAMAIRGEAQSCGVYEAAFSQFEPGLSLQHVNHLFTALESWLPEKIQEIIRHQGQWPKGLPGGRTYAAEDQKAIGETLMRSLGFDFDAGRLDVSLHPFCGGISGDVRITTRYETDSFTDALMAVLHETGHAMYEAGLPADWHGQPVGNSRGMTVHESQSLFVEMQLCRSHAYLDYLSEQLKPVFGADDPACSPEFLRQTYHRVEPSLIRVMADEVTYPLHIILRTRLEQQLIEQTLLLKDLPEAWNESMRSLLGIVPANDAEGCLQDIHWPAGLFGYFPCYSLGALLAAQLGDVLRQDLPNIDDHARQGQFQPIMHWLKDTIHQQGCLLDTNDLIMQSTGQKLGVDAYQRHIERRYLS